MKPNLENPHHNAFVQDYLSAIQKQTQGILDLNDLPNHRRNLLNDVATIEAAIELVQEFYRNDGTKQPALTTTTEKVQRDDAIHQLLNKLQEELDAVQLPYMAESVDRLHHDFQGYIERLKRNRERINEEELDISSKEFKLTEPIYNEDLATWIFG